MEALYGKAIVVADREMIESRPEEIIGPAKTMRVALLVVGDPFCATTHADFFIRARAENIPVEVIHNTSIMTAIGCCGLQLYNFGPSVSLCFFTEKWKPTSFYPKIAINRRQGFHTLVLLAHTCMQISK
ncbi:tetrapyrrole methylase [Pelomyxa schiedti]|nr:tetrapyrrole methylase [Pelomyxa schiedti]